MRAALDRCDPRPGTTLVKGVERLIDASRNNYPDDTGRWRVAEIY
jgi:hypothetical protein